MIFQLGPNGTGGLFSFEFENTNQKTILQQSYNHTTAHKLKLRQNNSL